MAKAMEKVGEARPYVERAFRDEDLRDNMKNAFMAARDAYYDLFGDQGMRAVAVRAATDKDVQDNLKKAIEELREAADRVQGKEDHGLRNTILLVSGVALAALFNPVTGPQTRKWLSEQLFGGGEEFTYSGSTTGSSGSTGGSGNSGG